MKLRLLTVVSCALFCLPAFAQTSKNTSTNTTTATPAPTSSIVSAPVDVQPDATPAPATAVTKPTTPAATTTAITAAPTTTSTTTLNTDSDKISYAIGVNIGQNFKDQHLTINTQAIAQGINDGYNGSKTLMSSQDMQSTLLSFQKNLIAQRQEQLTQTSDQNTQQGTSFLAQNKNKPGVVTLPDGLQYKIITPGAGASPTDKDSVTVNYVGSFINGQVFDSSYQRGKPATFPVTEVIPGWTEALKMMKPGATWEIYVPSSLAYGDRGIGPIGPNQTLIFKINLISVNAPGSK